MAALPSVTNFLFPLKPPLFLTLNLNLNLDLINIIYIILILHLLALYRRHGDQKQLRKISVNKDDDRRRGVSLTLPPLA